MRNKKFFLMLLAIGAAALVQGCMVAAVGAGAAGTVAYVRGDLEAVAAEDIEAVYNAAVKAMDELELVVTQKTKDMMSAKILARDAADKKITVKLAATEQSTTKISIRVGIFGNETKSRLIYEQIKKGL